MSIDIETEQSLFRYGSEWNPKAHAQTKGGYIQGRISLPAASSHGGGPLKMSLETYPVDGVPDIIKDVQPLILHFVKLGKGRREQDKEPVPNNHHWKLDFLIEKDGKVYIENRTSELDVNYDGSKRSVPAKDLIGMVHDGNIMLGGKRGQLSFVILTPKQDARAKEASAEEATVGRVLRDRMDRKNQRLLEKMIKEFKVAMYMKRVRLRVKFYKETSPGKWTEFWSDISETQIIDIGSKDIGALELHDVHPLKSCSKGGRKITMMSEYDLAENTIPIFQVWKDGVHRKDLDKFLIQPSFTNGRTGERAMYIRKSSITFLTPNQPLLHDLGHEAVIKLTLKRGGDGQLSNNAFDFGYDHHPSTSECPYCDMHIDSSERATIQKPSERARPGTKKKQMKSIKTVSSSSRAISPTDYDPHTPTSYPTSPSLPCPSKSTTSAFTASPSRLEAEDEMTACCDNAEDSLTLVMCEDSAESATASCGNSKESYAMKEIDIMLTRTRLPEINDIIMETSSTAEEEEDPELVIGKPLNYTQLFYLE